MSIDKFFHKKYNKNSYNCAHFVCDVWESETGKSITESMKCFLLPTKERFASMGLLQSFRKIAKPVSPCIALFTAPSADCHVGIYLRGRVFHLAEQGAQFQPVEIVSMGFKKVGFYK